MASSRRSEWPLRAACLRGIAAEADGLHALIALSAEQYLRLPLAASELPHWQARVGRRVWVDMSSQPMRLQAESMLEVRHA